MPHDLVRIDETLKSLIDEAVILTPYAWSFRYPGGIDEPTEIKSVVLVF